MLARELDRPVYAIDLRNHGDSPHNPEHNYRMLAHDVEGFMAQHDLVKPTLIGHSMGAKTAMTLALTSPSKIANLIPVDNAPVDAALKSDFGQYVQGMRRIADSPPKSQREADSMLELCWCRIEIPYKVAMSLLAYDVMNHTAWRWYLCTYCGRCCC